MLACFAPVYSALHALPLCVERLVLPPAFTFPIFIYHRTIMISTLLANSISTSQTPRDRLAIPNLRRRFQEIPFSPYIYFRIYYFWRLISALALDHKVHFPPNKSKLSSILCFSSSVLSKYLYNFSRLQAYKIIVRKIF